MTARACELDPPWDCLMETVTSFSFRYWAMKAALSSRQSFRVGSYETLRSSMAAARTGAGPARRPARMTVNDRARFMGVLLRESIRELETGLDAMLGRAVAAG